MCNQVDRLKSFAGSIKPQRHSTRLDLAVLVAAGHLVGPVVVFGRNATRLDVGRGEDDVGGILHAGGVAHGVVEEVDATVRDGGDLVGGRDAGQVGATARAAGAGLQVTGPVALAGGE